MNNATFGMANDDSKESIVKATQEAFIKTMRKIIGDMKNDFKAPGLTWEQIDYFLAEMEKKKPTIIEQEYET